MPQIFVGLDVLHKEASSRMLYMELLGTKATCMRHPDDIQAVFNGDPLLYSKAAPGLKRLVRWLGNGLVVNADVEHHAKVRGRMQGRGAGMSTADWLEG